jgi:hypothetical protein
MIIPEDEEGIRKQPAQQRQQQRLRPEPIPQTPTTLHPISRPSQDIPILDGGADLNTDPPPSYEDTTLLARQHEAKTYALRRFLRSLFVAVFIYVLGIILIGSFVDLKWNRREGRVRVIFIICQCICEFDELLCREVILKYLRLPNHCRHRTPFQAPTRMAAFLFKNGVGIVTGRPQMLPSVWTQMWMRFASCRLDALSTAKSPSRRVSPT